MENRKTRCPGCRRKSCDGCGIFQKLNTNKNVRISFPESFQAEPGEGLGISFDVGTTSLAGMLWDLKEGSLLGAETGANPQALFGADVVSRVQAAVEDQEKLQKMQKLLTGSLDRMAEQLWDTVKREPDLPDHRIRKAAIVGNTAMCELLMGLMPTGLFKAPFRPDYNAVVQMEGSRLGFRFLKDAQIMILPPVGGYVGGDALMVHSYVNLKEPNKRILSIDIGTNGEILLQTGSKKFACSAAAGPALEGGAVSQGMRAAKGAIDMVSLSGRFPMQDIGVRVIGGGKSSGICGSGLLDAAACLLEQGLIDETGRMKETYYFTSAVYITQKDIRELQLAKAAIAAGIRLLCKHRGIAPGEIQKLLLAGAFGNYLKPESACAVGLLPVELKERICAVGNAAGEGAQIAVLNRLEYERAEELASRTDFLELSTDPEFQEIYVEDMALPVYNLSHSLRLLIRLLRHIH